MFLPLRRCYDAFTSTSSGKERKWPRCRYCLTICCWMHTVMRFACAWIAILFICFAWKFAGGSLRCRTKRRAKDASFRRSRRNRWSNCRTIWHACRRLPLRHGRRPRRKLWQQAGEKVHRAHKVRSNHPDDLCLRQRNRNSGMKRLGGTIHCIPGTTKEGILLGAELHRPPYRSRMPFCLGHYSFMLLL